MSRQDTIISLSNRRLKALAGLAAEPVFLSTLITKHFSGHISLSQNSDCLPARPCCYMSLLRLCVEAYTGNPADIALGGGQAGPSTRT
jgi:hypothetical protein